MKWAQPDGQGSQDCQASISGIRFGRTECIVTDGAFMVSVCNFSLSYMAFRRAADHAVAN
jgi:hypothetical protein